MPTGQSRKPEIALAITEDSYLLGAPGVRNQHDLTMPDLRQKIMILYLSNSALDSDVRGWTIYDGTGQANPTTGDSDTPPYKTGLEAMQDGWRVIQFPQLIPPYPEMEYTTSYFKFEYVFEKMVEV